MLLGDTINLDSIKEGKEFEVVKVTHGGTGYIWIPWFDPTHFQFMKEVVESSTLPGGLVTYTFTFKVLLIGGKTFLNFLLVRPWKGGEVGEVDLNIIPR
jgi:hypothetical protein